MMNHPPVNELVEKTGSRYMLVTAVANRARQLQDDPDQLNGQKSVSVAVEEIYEGKVTIHSKEE